MYYPSKGECFTKHHSNPKLSDQVFSLFHHHFVFLVSTQSIYFALFFLILVPLLTLGYEVSLLTSQLSYVSLSNLPRFLINPVTLFFLVIILFLISVFLLAEDFFLKEFFFIRYNNVSFSRFNLILTSLKHTFNIIKGFKFRNLISIWITMISFNLPLILFTVRNNLYIRYVSTEVSSIIVWSGIAIVYFACTIALFRTSFKSIKIHILWNIVQTWSLSIVYILSIVIILLLVSILIPQEFAISAFINVLTRFNSLFSLFLFIVSTLLHYALNTVSSPLILEVEDLDYQNIKSTPSKFENQSPRRKLMIFALLLFLIVDVYLTLGILRNGSILQSSSQSQIGVTSHRGYSFDTPENTIIAIERAIEVFADFVEFDVRVTSDSQFILLHDDNLRRTTGLNRSVTRLTLASVLELDAGKWFRSEFEGTKIPTLQEALETTKGRILVNLDLKLGDNQTHLVPRLVEIIDEYEMQYQIMITSTCLPCLHEVKNINPNIQTGFITYRVTASLLNDPNIDIMSVKASFVTQSMVDKIHQSGKQIFVWTVNTQSEIERMSNLRVNNIITSRPTYVKEVLFELSASRFILNLIRIIIN